MSLNLTFRINEARVTAVAFILPRLSLYQGVATTYKTTWPHIEGLQLADPQFSAADPIEMLLGAEVCSIILQEGLRKGDPHTPVAQHTLLGWILSGDCGENLSATPHRSFQCTADHELTTRSCNVFGSKRRNLPPHCPSRQTSNDARNSLLELTAASMQGGTLCDCHLPRHQQHSVTPANQPSDCSPPWSDDATASMLDSGVCTAHF